MALFDKSVLKPEGSVVAGIATAGLVYAIYQMDLGPVAQVHASPPNLGFLEPSRKKAAYTSFATVAALTLIAKDANIGILGFVSIIAMEVHYRHAIMSNPDTGTIEPPSPTKYVPAENVVPITGQGDMPPAEAFGY
jgi:hypothetical protein